MATAGTTVCTAAGFVRQQEKHEALLQRITRTSWNAWRTALYTTYFSSVLSRKTKLHKTIFKPYVRLESYLGRNSTRVEARKFNPNIIHFVWRAGWESIQQASHGMETLDNSTNLHTWLIYIRERERETDSVPLHSADSRRLKVIINSEPPIPPYHPATD